MMCLLLSRGLSKVAPADFIDRTKARPQITCLGLAEIWQHFSVGRYR